MKFLFGVIFASLSVGFAQQPIPSICVEKPINYFVRNVSDCAGWIHCTDHVDGPISGFCPSPFHFDESRQVCTQPEKANCFTCPPTGIVFEVVENTCNRFVRCIFGVPTEWYCEDGKQYSKNKNSCDDKNIVQCEEACPLYLKGGEFTAKNDANNCSLGLVCYGEPQPYLIYCDEKLHFDPTTLMCVKPEKSTCISKDMDDEGNCLTYPEPGNFIAKHDSNNCSIGLVCYGEPTAQLIHCSEKLHFDTTSLMCVQPEMSDCVSKQTTVITTVPTTTSTTPSTTSEPATISTTPTTTSEPTTTSTTASTTSEPTTTSTTTSTTSEPTTTSTTSSTTSEPTITSTTPSTTSESTTISTTPTTTSEPTTTSTTPSTTSEPTTTSTTPTTTSESTTISTTPSTTSESTTISTTPTTTSEPTTTSTTASTTSEPTTTSTTPTTTSEPTITSTTPSTTSDPTTISTTPSTTSESTTISTTPSTTSQPTTTSTALSATSEPAVVEPTAPTTTVPTTTTINIPTPPVTFAFL